jgi:large subunit ribosomal protein L9
MEVILLSDVEKVGLRGEVVDVARGYARNFLLPRRLAEEATPGRVAELRKREEQRGRQEARSAEQASEIAGVLGKTVLSFDVKSGPTGSLFGSVTPTDIADEIWRTRKIRVDRRKIGLDEPIKRIGRYSVPITVFEGVEVEVKTLVVPEGGELPPEEELEAMVAAEEAAAAAEQEAGADGQVVDPLEAAVEELVAAEEAAAEEETAVEPEPEAAAEQVPGDAFDTAVDEADADDGQRS